MFISKFSFGLFHLVIFTISLQPDQITMAVLFWYLATSNASVRYYTVVYAGPVTFYRVAETHGHV